MSDFLNIDDRKHVIEILHADGRSEWFFGWDDVDAMTGPDFTTDRDLRRRQGSIPEPRPVRRDAEHEQGRHEDHLRH